MIDPTGFLLPFSEGNLLSKSVESFPITTGHKIILWQYEDNTGVTT